jgi:uncharacterized protein Yka (UPF0111/DUF47 family)
MPKTHIVEALGETALLLPAAVSDALAANDRIKYYMSLLQACREHAARPGSPAPDLRAEREACGEADASLDVVIDASRLAEDGALVVPRADRIHARLMDALDRMIAPLRNADSGVTARETYERRLAALRDRLPQVDGDRIPPAYLDAVTRGESDAGDTLHLLVMNLHRELNGIQGRLAEETIDGAQAYGLGGDDRPLVAAFMRGVNRTAPLKFGHPGLGTTATRAGGRVVIQNDIGTTDAHVLVVHVEGLQLSIIHSDVHPSRIRFFKTLLEPLGITWSQPPLAAPSEGTQYETCVGRVTAGSPDELRGHLEMLGSRLVFLIDWNRARKRLSRFARKADAIAALGWAAEHGYGHRAFLETGGERLVYSVVERTPQAQMPYGARLDDVLGRGQARAFLESVLRITSEGLKQRRSLTLIRDEIQADLLERLNETQQGIFAMASDHAALVAALALALRDALRHTRLGADRAGAQAVAERAKRWESKADDIVSRARHRQIRAPGATAIAALLTEADDVADDLEEATFLLTLVPEQSCGREAVESLDALAGLAAAGAQEYVRCLEIARDLRRAGTHEDVDAFLLAVDRVAGIEHESDEAERRSKAALLHAAGDFRMLSILSQIARALEATTDGLSRCALSLKDHVMSELLVE